MGREEGARAEAYCAGAAELMGWLQAFAQEDAVKGQGQLCLAALKGLCALQYRTDGAASSRRLCRESAREALKKEVTVSFFSEMVALEKTSGRGVEENMLSSLPAPWLEAALDLGLWDDEEEPGNHQCLADLRLLLSDKRLLALARHARGATGVLAPLSALPHARLAHAPRSLWEVLLSSLRLGGTAPPQRVL